MHAYSSKGKGAIPEGFFDDPKLDAKARKVEYKDPMNEEWEKFQKTIQKEDDVSTSCDMCGKLAVVLIIFHGREMKYVPDNWFHIPM